MKIFIPSQNLILATTIFLVYIVPLRAQDSSEDYVDAHNKARAAVGVGPLTWDAMLATEAGFSAFQRGTSGCSTRSWTGSNGVNIARGSSTMSGVEAVEMWVNEKSDYDYNSNTCAVTKNCSSYTKVVWRNSVKLGCGKARCTSGETLVVCEYDPPGNVNGERPY
ncbi:unnamed protein product [Eruca vesicaria subsp. sativa]|uniref:SCP domain-containing protein n=1 Tax=Eruca vesicaria subsp. sativa TaxID=29727 RepID=A0ABC8L1D1_ERUVS|nr:unnamed protein product [Eruca vesicaria subsp. sativa]